MNNSRRPVGHTVDPKPPGLVPDRRILEGRYVRLEPLDAARHGRQLFTSFDGKDPQGHVWTYLGYGPFKDFADFEIYLRDKEASRDPWFYAFVDRMTGDAVGVGSFMRADPANGVIEIGHIWMSPGLQQTREATEAIYLMMAHCFDDLKVRRLEWKCDALNAPSRRAADRFGFSFEGVFRQHLIVKGRNRDTAWFAIIESEWPGIRKGFEDWLRPANFDGEGKQKAKLRVR